MMNNTLTLKILDRFSGLFKVLGADYEKLRLVLGFKLMMDKRRVPTIMQDSRQKENTLLTPFVKSLLLYAFYGLFLIPFLIMGDAYLFQLSIVFTIVMFILMTSMIADFSSVLLDVRDKVILDTKPIDSKTLSVAKFTHIVIYMTQLTGALLLIPLIVSIVIQGVAFALILIISLIFVSILCIVLTAIFYILVLKFFDGEKLRNMINSIQIVLTVGIVVGYQLIARSFEMIDMTLAFEWQWWHLLLPPMWYSAIFELILLQNTSLAMILSALIAIFIPLLALWLYFKLMPTFERNLQKLMSATHTRKQKKSKLMNGLSKWLCRDQKEQAAFHFALTMLRKEREFKLKVYPVLGLSLVFPFIMIFTLGSQETEIDFHFSYLYAYFSVLMIPTVVYMLKYSSKAKGAWLYHVVPIEDAKTFYRATLKASLVQLFMPIILVQSLVFIYLAGPIMLLHGTIIFLIGCLFTAICYLLVNKGQYPFSEPFSFVESASTALMFVSMLIVVIFGLIHFLVNLVPIGLIIYAVVLMVCNYLVWRKML